MKTQRYTALLVCLIVASLVSTALSFSYQRKCVNGKSYNDGCNMCHCAEGKVLCTFKACVVKPNSENGGNLQTRTLEPPADFWEISPEIKLPHA